MRRFYLVVEKRQSLIVQFKSLNISWTFIIKLLKLNDVNLKKEFHNKTTGVLLVRENNKWLIKYINNNDIVVREFITSN